MSNIDIEILDKITRRTESRNLPMRENMIRKSFFLVHDRNEKHPLIFAKDCDNIFRINKKH